MSKLTEIIFAGQPHYLTSPYGRRSRIKTSAGSTAAFHYGADYGTNGRRLPQHAIEDGYIESCGTAADGANYVWVVYPRIGKKMLHYHLDGINVKKDQRVTKGTLLGTTGKTGKATGIHLHLGIKDMKTGSWINPESYAKKYAPETKFSAGKYVVNTHILNVRTGPSVKSEKKSFSQLSENAQQQILKISGRKINGYVKGVQVSVKDVRVNWGRTPSGWVCLDYCKRVG